MEDVVINGYTQVLLAAIGTALTGTIGALWFALNEERKGHGQTRDKMQDKLDNTTEKAIMAINASTNNMNHSASLLVSIQSALSKMDDRWANLEKEILRGIGK